MKSKEIKEVYLLQKITVTLLVLTTTAGLQMVALCTKCLVVKATRSLRTSTENFRFEDDISIRPGVLIRPDTLYLCPTIISARYIYFPILYLETSSILL